MHVLSPGWAGLPLIDGEVRQRRREERESSEKGLEGRSGTCYSFEAV